MTNKEDVVRIHPVRKFFLVCSGASLNILSHPDCQSELTRYAMMGAFVALTATFATLSGGYALYAGFKSYVVAIPAGILWGAFIFTLDRFIVSSLKKKRIEPDLSLSGKAAVKLIEFGAALPRLVLATFIAMTVAVPLEMKYFESEIDAQLARTNLEAAPYLANKALEGFPEIKTREKELEALTKRENELTERRNTLRDQLRNEVDGVEGDGYTGERGDGPQAAVRRAEYKQVDGELAKALTENAPEKEKLRKRLNELRAQAAAAGEGARGELEQGNGFLARYKTLRQLSEDGPVADMSLFLIILLTLVETTPVVAKLFAGRGPYDDVLEMIEHKVHINQQKEISVFNSDVNTELEIYKTSCEARRQDEERRLHLGAQPARGGWGRGGGESGFSSRGAYANGGRGGDGWNWEAERAATD
jgi:Domain of unknown function (DUF4407)